MDFNFLINRWNIVFLILITCMFYQTTASAESCHRNADSKIIVADTTSTPVSHDSGSNYNVAKTSTNFSASHHESDSATLLGYNGSWDLAQGTGVQYLTAGTGSDNDQSASGFLHLFDPPRIGIIAVIFFSIYNFCNGYIKFSISINSKNKITIFRDFYFFFTYNYF